MTDKKITKYESSDSETNNNESQNIIKQLKTHTLPRKKYMIDSISSDSETNVKVRKKYTNYNSSDSENKKKIRKKHIKNSNEIFKELVNNQLPNVPNQWKLGINDMKRICKYIDTSIFDKDTCCIWNGYITNMNNSNKGTYVNFYFKNKKVALHRLLYSNFVAPLDSSEYLKFNCENKGICCNINHYEKYKYSKSIYRKEIKKKEIKKDIPDIVITTNKDDKLTIDFD